MQRFFDAHVYVAKWMAAIFMVHLPIGAMAKETAEAYSFHASRKRFQQELNKFMAVHMRRNALIKRLVKAGIRHEK